MKQILGLPEGTSDKDLLKKAFRRQLLVLHPDKNEENIPNRDYAAEVFMDYFYPVKKWLKQFEGKCFDTVIFRV